MSKSVGSSVKGGRVNRNDVNRNDSVMSRLTPVRTAPAQSGEVRSSERDRATCQDEDGVAVTRRRAVLILVAGLVVAGLTVSTATGILPAGVRLGMAKLHDAGDPGPAPGPGTTTAQTPASSSATPSPSPAPVKTVQPGSSLDPVLSPAKPERAAAEKLKKRIAGVHKPKHVGVLSAAVQDAATGKMLYSHHATEPMAPASTNKLLTSAAALQRLDGQHRFRTKVVTGKSGGIILVGGGDPYLTSKTHTTDPLRGSLQQLAAATAEKLRSNGTKRIRLGYDATLFDGPAWNSHWPTDYRDQVTPVSALWVDEGRVSGGSHGKRQRHPAKAAAEVFAKWLKKYKVKTTSIATAHARPGKDREQGRGRTVASVDSLPLSVIVERLLRSSDNDAAEVVARQVAIAAGRTPSFSGAIAAIKHTLTKVGVWKSGTRMYDGSGLSRDDRVPPVLFIAILRHASAGKARWGPLLAGLPVAHAEGSLRHHYGGSQAEAARGRVHAKTGTLRGIHSLAGYVYTPDGELLTFALIVNHSKQDWAAPIWLHRITAAIASCGCRG